MPKICLTSWKIGMKVLKREKMTINLSKATQRMSCALSRSLVRILHSQLRVLPRCVRTWEMRRKRQFPLIISRLKSHKWFKALFKRVQISGNSGLNMMKVRPCTNRSKIFYNLIRTRVKPPLKNISLFWKAAV